MKLNDMIINIGTEVSVTSFCKSFQIKQNLLFLSKPYSA